jgi:hypothetical protein
LDHLLNVKYDYFANNTAHSHQRINVIVKAIKRCYLHAAESKWATIMSEDEICFSHAENTDMAIIHSGNNLVVADTCDTIYLTTVVRY